MSTATALQRIAERLRTINTDSAANAERYIQRHTGDACRLIQPHWQTIVSRAGIDWTGPEPFPAAEPCDPVTDLQLWALAWQSIASVLWFSMRGHHWPGMPELTTTRREPGLSVSTVTHNATDWKERAKDYAEILEAVAGFLSEEFSTNRTPKEWRRLRKNSGLADSETTWRNEREKHPEHFRGESKSVRISRWLADHWNLNLPEFQQPASS
jgi:hypothetical protein